MNERKKYNNLLIMQVLVITLIVTIGNFLLQGNKGVSLWDEGFLWYGAQRVVLGEIPIRDFMAYDPARYYWSAAFMRVLGDNGIIDLRISVTVFQALGLFVGMLLIARSYQGHRQDYLVFLIVAAVTLVVWMFPRHKLFDISISLFLIGLLTFLIEKPSTKRYFIAGFGVGLAAIFGRNHGVYGLIGSLGVIFWLYNRRSTDLSFTGFVYWLTGVTVGFSPLLLMVLFIPDFKEAFWESILFLFEHKTTNLPLPVPWPWAVNYSSASLGDGTRGFLVGLFFICTLIFGFLSILWVALCKLKRKPVPSAFVAAAFLSIPYTHFAFSRADIAHLAQGIFPFLLGSFVLLSTRSFPVKWLFSITLLATSFWVMYIYHPGWLCLGSKECVNVTISDRVLQVDIATAQEITLLRELSDSYAPNGQSIVAVPFWPGAYALLERKSPIWEIYALSPYRSDAFQREEIKRIEKADPGLVIVLDLPLDGRDDLRYQNTHEILNQYFEENYSLLDRYTDNPNLQIYVKD